MCRRVDFSVLNLTPPHHREDFLRNGGSGFVCKGWSLALCSGFHLVIERYSHVLVA